jgi:iron complex outermembrane receptor protein
MVQTAESPTARAERRGFVALAAAVVLLAGGLAGAQEEPVPTDGAAAAPGADDEARGGSAPAPASADGGAGAGDGAPSGGAAANGDGPDGTGADGAASRGPDPYETEVRATALEDETPQMDRVARDRIDSAAAASVADVLEREAGVYASTGRRGERHIAIRGFDQRQVFVVIDGVPAYLPYDGDIDLGKIPAGLVEDVVVLRPPGSLRFGPSGMGGTVSVRTRQPGEGPLVGLRFEGGRGPHLQLDGLHSHRAGRWSWVVGGGLERRDAYPLSGRFRPTHVEDGGDREQSDRRLGHVFGRLRLDLRHGGHLEATCWHVGGEWGVPPSTAVPRPRYWRITDLATTVATLAHRWRPTPGLVVQELVFVGLFDDLLDAFDDGTYRTQERRDSFHSWYHDLTAGGWVRARYALPRRTLLRLDIGARYEHHAQDMVLGDGTAADADASERVLVSLGGQVESRPTRAVRVAAALQTEIETGLAEALAPAADAMVDLRWTPRGGLLSLGASVARRSRTPTLKERFSGMGNAGRGGRLPNPDLRPEAALHFGVDATLRLAPWLAAEVTAFEAEVRDLIDLSTLDAATEQFRNVAHARQAGVEVAVVATPRWWLEVEAAYAYLYAREVLADEGTAPLEYRPEHLARAAARLRPLRWLLVSTTLRLVGPQSFRDPTSHNWRTLGAYVAWDARVEAGPWRGVRVWAQATNLLDASYQTQYGYPEPGWQIWAGARLEVEAR